MGAKKYKNGMVTRGYVENEMALWKYIEELNSIEEISEDFKWLNLIPENDINK